MPDDDAKALKNIRLLSSLSDNELEILFPFLKKIEFPSLETIFEEGDTDNLDIYFIAEGLVKVYKWDEKRLSKIYLRTLQEGDSFGEMSFLDGSSRSSTIESYKGTTLYTLSPHVFDGTSIDLLTIYNKIIKNIALENCERIQSSNRFFIESSVSCSKKLQFSIDSTVQLLYLFASVVVLNFFFYLFLGPFKIYNPELYYYFFWLIMGGIFYFFYKKFSLNPENLGIKEEGLLPAVKNALLASLFAIPAVWIFSLIFAPSINSYPLDLKWVLAYLSYTIIYEIIARGYLLNTLKNDFNLDKIAYSIFLSSAFLAILPALPYSPVPLVIFSFSLNVLMGILFSLNNNLAGVIVAHFLIGISAKFFNLI